MNLTDYVALAYCSYLRWGQETHLPMPGPGSAWLSVVVGQGAPIANGEQLLRDTQG